MVTRVARVSASVGRCCMRSKPLLRPTAVCLYMSATPFLLGAIRCLELACVKPLTGSPIVLYG